MRKSLLQLCIIFYILPLQSQICDYVAIGFEDITPAWRHLTIDSTIIGYTDTAGFRQTFYPDGMEHLSVEEGSFVNGNYLYSLVKSRIDRDVSGAIIEKIDLETGELKWKIIEDLRTLTHREEIFQAGIVDEKFVIYGFRDAQADSIYTDIANFERQLEGVYFRKEYDLITGEKLLDYTPSDEDTLIQSIQKTRDFAYTSFFLDSLVTFQDKRNFEVGKGFNLTRTVYDSNGYLKTKEDTVVAGRFSDRLLLDGIIQDRPRFTFTPENTYLYIEHYYPKEDVNHSFEGILTEYDKDFNRLREVDVKTFGFTEFSHLEVFEVTSDRILLHGCSDLTLGFNQWPCEEFYLLLDRSFNLISRFYIANNQLDLQRTLRRHVGIVGDRVYVFNPIFEDVGPSYLELYRSNELGTLDLLKRVSLTTSEWVGFVDKFFVLEDGDILMRFTHSCFVNGDKKSWHPEWFRIDTADFLGTTSTDEVSVSDAYSITISPNPAEEQLTLELDEAREGKIEIRDMTGRLMMSQNIGQSKVIQLSIADYNIGTYLLTITGKDGEKTVRQFVKI